MVIHVDHKTTEGYCPKCVDLFFDGDKTKCIITITDEGIVTKVISQETGETINEQFRPIYVH